MKKLGLLVAALFAAQLSRSAPVKADPVIYYCELTGAGYAYLDRDSYQACIANCYVVDAQNQVTYGECWTTPPTPTPGPGTPNNPDPGGPSTET